MIVRFGYRPADDDGSSFALQPGQRPMPGFRGFSRFGDDPGDPSMYGVGTDPGTGPTNADGTPYDPTQVGSTSTNASGAVQGPPNPNGTPAGTTYVNPTGTPASTSSPSTLASILGFLTPFAPKPAVAAPPKPASSMVLPIVLAAGLGLVALLVSRKK